MGRAPDLDEATLSSKERQNHERSKQQRFFYDDPNHLVDLFEQSAALRPPNRLFGTKNPDSGQYEWSTFGQIARRVDCLRGVLKTLGLARGEKVGVILNNCEEWFVCEQATHGLGGCFRPHVPPGASQGDTVRQLTQIRKQIRDLGEIRAHHACRDRQIEGR